MSVQPGFPALEQHRMRIAAQQENSARLASAYATFTSHGWGEIAVPDAVQFHTTFIGRPSVSYGSSIDGDTLVAGRFPRTNGGVAKWLTDSKGGYIGAWVYLVVDTVPPFYAGVDVTAPPPASIDYSIVHYFTFAGDAMKTVPYAALAP